MCGSIKGSHWMITTISVHDNPVKITKLSPSDNSVVKIGLINLKLAAVVGNQMQMRFPHVFGLESS